MMKVFLGCLALLLLVILPYGSDALAVQSSRRFFISLRLRPFYSFVTATTVEDTDQCLMDLGIDEPVESAITACGVPDSYARALGVSKNLGRNLCILRELGLLDEDDGSVSPDGASALFGANAALTEVSEHCQVLASEDPVVVNILNGDLSDLMDDADGDGGDGGDEMMETSRFRRRFRRFRKRVSVEDLVDEAAPLVFLGCLNREILDICQEDMMAGGEEEEEEGGAAPDEI